jgi:hypothetical protein
VTNNNTLQSLNVNFNEIDLDENIIQQLYSIVTRNFSSQYGSFDFGNYDNNDEDSDDLSQ